MAPEEQLKGYAEAITRTGFPLEHWASTVLKRRGWTVINNKYYVDADEARPREIDILAYKSSSFEDFDLRTSLLISCKKSDSKVWAFLRRDADHKNPNVNWRPAHVWTDSAELNFFVKSSGWEERFYASMVLGGLSDLFCLPEHEVFAYQEMPKGTTDKKVSPTDAAIQSSIMSLIKAQHYEVMSRHPYAKPRIYQFNLISLTEGEFVGLDFDADNQITPSYIADQVALARYNINRSDVFSRIYFVTKGAFEGKIERFDKVHRLNGEEFEEMFVEFYKDAVRDSKKRAVFSGLFNKRAERAVWREIFNLAGEYPKKLEFSIDVLKSGKVEVQVGTGDFGRDDVIDTPEVQEALRKVLKDVYRYEGPFDVSIDIPF